MNPTLLLFFANSIKSKENKTIIEKYLYLNNQNTGMKIEIDTKHDSPEEIQKVIKMLQHLVGQNSYTNTKNIFEDPDSFGTSSEPTLTSEPEQSEPTNAFVNMFGSTPTPTEGPKDEPMDQPEEEKEDIPEVIPY